MALDYVALVFFLLTAFIVISVVVFQPALRIGSLFKGKKVAVPYYIFPLIAVLILLIAGKFSLQTVSDGLLGDDDIQPLAIVCIFMTLAYICIALDHTGFFHWVSYAMLRAAGDSGSRLYLYAYILTALLTVLTDNGVVVLTLTPILIYFTSKTENVGPIPFVTTEFYVAQVAGAARLIGNPATIIVSQAQGLDFVSYMRWMMLPTVCALIFMYFELNAMFGTRCQKNSE
jgi:Na+/H+ antiporter NhaD/arsenite permease-like protein